MVFVAIAFLAGITLAIVESTLVRALAISSVRPDLVVLAIVVATCRTSFGRAMVLAFVLGLTRDFFSGGIVGINAFSLSFMAYMLISAQDYLLTNNWKGQVVVVFVGSMVFGVLFVFLKLVLGYEIASPIQAPIKILWTAAYTSVLGPFVFMLVNRPQSLPYMRLKMKYDVESETLHQTKV